MMRSTGLIACRQRPARLSFRLDMLGMAEVPYGLGHRRRLGNLAAIDGRIVCIPVMSSPVTSCDVAMVVDCQLRLRVSFRHRQWLNFRHHSSHFFGLLLLGESFFCPVDSLHESDSGDNASGKENDLDRSDGVDFGPCSRASSRAASNETFRSEVTAICFASRLPPSLDQSTQSASKTVAGAATRGGAPP